MTYKVEYIEDKWVLIHNGVHVQSFESVERANQQMSIHNKAVREAWTVEKIENMVTYRGGGAIKTGHFELLTYGLPKELKQHHKWLLNVHYIIPPIDCKEGEDPQHRDKLIFTDKEFKRIMRRYTGFFHRPEPKRRKKIDWSDLILIAFLIGVSLGIYFNV